MSNYFPFPKIYNEQGEFWKIAELSDLKENAGINVKLGDDEDYDVALFLVNGKVYCLHNVCPHRHQNVIHNGYLQENKIICPLHGWTYDLITGKNANPLQGQKSLQVFKTLVIDNSIYIEKPNIPIPKWRQIQ